MNDNEPSVSSTSCPDLMTPTHIIAATLLPFTEVNLSMVPHFTLSLVTFHLRTISLPLLNAPPILVMLHTPIALGHPLPGGPFFLTIGPHKHLRL